MSVTSHGPEPCASAYSAISASNKKYIITCLCLSSTFCTCERLDFQIFSSQIFSKRKSDCGETGVNADSWAFCYFNCYPDRSLAFHRSGRLRAFRRSGRLWAFRRPGRLRAFHRPGRRLTYHPGNYPQ